MFDTQLIVVVGFPEERQVSRVSILAFPLFNLVLHQNQVGRKLELLAVAKPHVVVGLAFYNMYSFGFQGGIEIGEGFVEHAREEKQRWALVETLGFSR